LEISTMKANQLEAVLRAAWAAVNSNIPFARNSALGDLHAAISRADPHGVYKPQAPQPAAVDLEETQDIPLRDCPRLRPLPAGSGDAT
jgi:hypothetical protein